jgi:hypothetical protein
VNEATILLLSSSSEASTVFNWSASDNLVIVPRLPILFPVLNENDMFLLLPLRLREVRDKFDLSASNNLTAPLGPI